MSPVGTENLVHRICMAVGCQLREGTTPQVAALNSNRIAVTRLEFSADTAGRYCPIFSVGPTKLSDYGIMQDSLPSVSLQNSSGATLAPHYSGKRDQSPTG